MCDPAAAAAGDAAGPVLRAATEQVKNRKERA